jgi:hypothetical protein
LCSALGFVDAFWCLDGLMYAMPFRAATHAGLGTRRLSSRDSTVSQYRPMCSPSKFHRYRFYMKWLLRPRRTLVAMLQFDSDHLDAAWRRVWRGNITHGIFRRLTARILWVVEVSMLRVGTGRVLRRAREARQADGSAGCHTWGGKGSHYTIFCIILVLRTVLLSCCTHVHSRRQSSPLDPPN